MSVNKDSALFLFGGPEKVFDELTSIIQERLKRRSYSDLNELEHYLGLEENTLKEIKAGVKKADRKAFLALKGPLKLSLHDALKEPEKLDDPELKKYWEEECKSRPMRLVAYAGITSTSSISQNPVDLNMYVTLRAIGEFYRL